MAIKKSIRELAHKKYAGRCAYCGCDITLKTMQVDHIKPKINGGTDDLANLNPACRVCNNWKLFYTVEHFRSEIAAQVERLYLRSSNYRIARKYGLIRETNQDVSFYFERHEQEEIMTDHYERGEAIERMSDEIAELKAKCSRYEEALKIYANEENWWVPDYGNNKSCAFDYVGENRRFEGSGYELAQKALVNI